MRITLVLMSASLLLSFFVIITQQSTIEKYKDTIVKKDVKLSELQAEPEIYKTVVMTKNVEAKKQAEAKRKTESEQALKNLESMMVNASSKSSQGGLNKATSQIMAAIQRNMLTSSTMFGKDCVINIRVAPDGLILKVGEGRGDRDVCEAAAVAIRNAAPLPMPKDPELNKKLQNMNLTFKPM